MGNCCKKKYDDFYAEEFSPMSYNPNYDQHKLKKQIRFFSKKYNCHVLLTPKNYFSFD